MAKESLQSGLDFPVPGDLDAEEWIDALVELALLVRSASAKGRIDEVLLLSPPHQLRLGAPLRVTSASFNPHSPAATGQKHGASGGSATIRASPPARGIPSRVERHPHREAGPLRGHAAAVKAGAALLRHPPCSSRRSSVGSGFSPRSRSISALLPAISKTWTLPSAAPDGAVGVGGGIRGLLPRPQLPRRVRPLRSCRAERLGTHSHGQGGGRRAGREARSRVSPRAWRVHCA